MPSEFSAGTTLQNPASISMAGVSVNANSHVLTITGNNVTLNGYDFSLGGGWKIDIGSGVTNTVIENCNFALGSNNQVPIDAGPNAGNLTVLDRTFNGNSTTNGAVWAMISYIGSGTCTVRYDSFLNTPSDAIDFNDGTMTTDVEYNLFQNLGTSPGAHADTVQYIGVNSDDSVVSFNTVLSGEEGIQIDGYGGSMLNTLVENNVFIAPSPVGSMSVAVAIQEGDGGTNSGSVVDDNYMDSRNTYFPFYPPPQGTVQTFANNVNMVTGAAVASPSGTASTDVSSVTASPASGTVASASGTKAAVSGAATPASGTETPGSTILISLVMDEAEFVTGTPTLTLNDGGTATYSGGSGTSTLTFTYTVGATDTAVPMLAVTAVNLPNGATVKDAFGNAANLAGAMATFSGISIAATTAQPTVVWSPGTESGTEGSAIALGALAATAASGQTLSSLTVSGIPVGAKLTDGTNSFTAASGSTSVNVLGWSLGKLSLTPATDGSFALTATAADSGSSATATATETVTANPLAPTVSLTTPAVANAVAGVEGSAIPLGTLNVTVNGLAGDSNTLSSLILSGIPVGATITDGTNKFTATTASTSVNVTGWALANLSMTPVNDGVYSLTATATEHGAAGTTSSASVTETVTARALAPTVSWSTGAVTGAEGAAIALGTLSVKVNGLAGDTNTLASLILSGIPVGATITDGKNRFTATTSTTSVNVAGWALAKLSLTMAGTGACTLTATATEQGATGTARHACANETVTAGTAGLPAPTVAWSTSAVAGVEGATIALGTLSDAANGLAGDSATMASLILSGIFRPGPRSRTAPTSSPPRPPVRRSM